MVKRTAIPMRSKKSPRTTDQKNLRRSTRKRNSKSFYKISTPQLADTPNLQVPLVEDNKNKTESTMENLVVLGAEPISACCSGEDKKVDCSVISINDSTLIDSPSHEANDSCFIIDVEPNSSTSQDKLFYQYKNPFDEDKNVDGKREDTSDSSNTLRVPSEGEIIPTSCLSNDEATVHSSASSEKSNNLESNVTSSDNFNGGNTVVKTVSLQAVALFNDIFNQMKCDGFLGKRKQTDDRAGTSKHSPPYLKITPEADKYCPNVKKSRNGKWDSIKKNMDKSNMKNNSESSICVHNVSTDDSDVEFIGEYNPSDRLIELSDGEESVIIEDKIPLPKLRRQKKKSAVKRKQTLGNSTSKNMKNNRKNQSQPNKTHVTKSVKNLTSGEIDKCALRPIVIDGCNVGMGHSRSKILSVKGIKICYDYFHERGHDIKIFLPQSRKFSVMTTDWNMLDKMEKEGSVIFTPARRVDGKQILCYDDRFILEYATLKGAIIITRDNYKDLYDEREDFRETIRDRLLQYTFVEDLIMFPDDPLGRHGPKLNQFLRFPLDQINST